LPDSFAQAVLTFLNLAAPFVAAVFAMSGILLRSKANTTAAKAEIDVRIEKQRVDFAEASVQQALRLDDRLERERTAWKTDVDKLRAENTAGQIEISHYKGQLDIMQKTLSEATTRGADRDLLIGELKTELKQAYAQIDALRAELAEVRQQMLQKTVERDAATSERDKAVLDLAVANALAPALLAATPPVAPVVATP
jgi:chromosome segregation ATPase